nr:hypothetical protein [Tanacetum cinerariifolium]
ADSIRRYFSNPAVQLSSQFSRLIDCSSPYCRQVPRTKASYTVT